MSYKKSNWVPYDPTLSFEQNVTQGGTTTADKLNNMETGISNNDINKVNVSDMRKPANDVAGIEEVNAKQDKIGYTPADDSKVVHDNHDGTININGDSFTPAVLDSAINKNSQPIDTDVDTLVKPGLYYVSASAPNNPFKALMMLETKIQYDWNAFEGVQISYEVVNKSGIAVRSVNPNGSLTRISNALPWVFLSDDSKVAHLSGANNFDTVPTVNNNPLLLASSLPSDLARTGQDANVTGKLQRNGKDVATTDDVATASNTVLTSANNSISKLLQSSSNNDEDSAVTNSTSDTNNFYYWTE
jgi:hypothetical protein